MSQLLASDGQSIGVSASTSVPPVNTQDCPPRTGGPGAPRGLLRSREKGSRAREPGMRSCSGHRDTQKRELCSRALVTPPSQPCPADLGLSEPSERMAPGPRGRRPRPGVERPRGPPHGQSLPVIIPPDPDTAGLPAPAQEGFPQVRWAPATPPNHPEGHPQGTGCTCLPRRDLRSRAGGPDPGAGPGDTGERRGSPRPAGPGPDPEGNTEGPGTASSEPLLPS